jgi:hypothetical protein
MFVIFLIFPSFFFPVVSKESRLAFAPPQKVFTSRPKERTDIFATLYFTFVSCADHFKGVFCSAFASLSQNFYSPHYQTLRTRMVQSYYGDNAYVRNSDPLFLIQHATCDLMFGRHPARRHGVEVKCRWHVGFTSEFLVS